MVSKKTLAQALATLLFSLSLLDVTGRVDAQPADAGATTEKRSDLARKLVEVQREADRARAEVEDLRRRVEQEREQTLQAAQEATAQRDAARQAEAKARQQAEEALKAQAAARQAAEQALREARNAAERATYAADIRAAQQAFARQNEQAARGSLEGVPDLQQARVSLLRQFGMKRQELMAQLKHLDEEQQRMLEELQKKSAILRERSGRQGDPGTGSSSSGKLDQILERLQGIEMRLDRLEARQRGGKE